jgi:polyhydroxyalkanoate synthesis regulator protein
MWNQFLNFQGPAMQTMMASYMEQSQKMMQQMQSQLESQTRNMFTGFSFNEKKPK